MMLAQWNKMGIDPKNIDEFYSRAGRDPKRVNLRLSDAPVYSDL
jgi:hypothetical protein